MDCPAGGADTADSRPTMSQCKVVPVGMPDYLLEVPTGNLRFHTLGIRTTRLPYVTLEGAAVAIHTIKFHGDKARAEVAFYKHHQGNAKRVGHIFGYTVVMT